MELTVHTFPTLDTGIGRDAGFANDADLIAHAEAERAALPAHWREMLDKIEQEAVEQWLYGKGA